MGLVQYGGVRTITLIGLDLLSLKTSLALPWVTGTQDGSLCGCPQPLAGQFIALTALSAPGESWYEAPEIGRELLI